MKLTIISSEVQSTEIQNVDFTKTSALCVSVCETCK